MRILGIDYGDARIGLALSDASATLCGRAWTLTEWNLDRAVAAIADVVRTEGVERIVLGLPKNMDGTEVRVRKRAARSRSGSPRRRGWRSCSGMSGAAPLRRTASCTPTAARRKSTARRSTPWRRA